MDWVVLYLLGAFVLLYVLYEYGAISVKSSRVLIFIGTIYSARYKRSNGTIRRVFRPSESREYLFSFSSELSRGSVAVEILDNKKQSLLHLEGHETGKLVLEKGKKYILVLRMQNADGAHHLEYF